MHGTQEGVMMTKSEICALKVAVKAFKIARESIVSALDYDGLRQMARIGLSDVVPYFVGTKSLADENEIYAFARKTPAEEVVVIINAGESGKNVKLPYREECAWKNLVNEKIYRGDDISCEGLSGIILQNTHVTGEKWK